MRTAWMRADEPSEDEIRGEIFRQLMLNGQGVSICPTDVARRIANPWREHLEWIREVINQMAIEGLIEVVQKDQVVDGEVARGPVRIRLPLRRK